MNEVGEDHVVLINPRAVEVTGSAQQNRPEREDIIPSDLMVRTDFMEIVCQPNWVYHEMDKKAVEKSKEEKAKTVELLKAGKKPGKAPAERAER